MKRPCTAAFRPIHGSSSPPVAATSSNAGRNPARPSARNAAAASNGARRIRGLRTNRLMPIAIPVRAAEREGARALLVAGGVAANGRLRALMAERASLPLHIPPPALCTDNAAMIAAAAFRHLDAAVDPAGPLDVFPTARRGAWRP